MAAPCPIVQANLVIATIIPTSTKNTMAACIQIHVGDIEGEGYRSTAGRKLAPIGDASPILWLWPVIYAGQRLSEGPHFSR